jgi:NADPH2:quinone reductase
VKAVQINDYGPVENLELVDIAIPEPGPGEVRVKVAYAGLRWGDIMQRGGFPSRDRPVPFIGGQEAAGIIDALGSGVTDLSVGQPVFAAPPCGGFAEYVTLDAARVTPLPDNVPLEKSLAYPVNMRTAHLMVFAWAKIQPGETVVLHAAAGGVGLMALQIIKRKIKDVRVIGLCGSDEKCDLIRQHGADHAINYKTHDYVEEVLKITGPKAARFDFTSPLGAAQVVLNGVSGPTLETDYKIIQRRGRWVIYGWAGGRGTFDTSAFGYDGITVMPFSSLAWTGTPEDAASRKFVADWLANEELLDPTIFPIDDVVAAERAFEAGQTSGKIVLAL